MMRMTIRKWGNSLGLRIPASFAKEAGVEAGSDVELTLKDGDLVVKPLRRPRYRLQDLVKGITAENRHAEVDMGGPIGREYW